MRKITITIEVTTDSENEDSVQKIGDAAYANMSRAAYDTPGVVSVDFVSDEIEVRDEDEEREEEHS